MLMHRDFASLVLVDVQEKLTPHVLNSEKIIARCAWLIRLANELGVPTLVCEQYPSGLGHTIESLRVLLPSYQPIEKVHFSSQRNESFTEKLNKLGRKQVILVGIETHVCILQTALDLLATGQYDVFVVVDAVSSRAELDYKYGLKRMKQAGVHLVTSEMVFFEWVECAGTKAFKALSQSFLQK